MRPGPAPDAERGKRWTGSSGTRTGRGRFCETVAGSESNNRNPDTSAARQPRGSINRRQRNGKIDAGKRQIAVLDHHRCRRPVPLAVAAQQLSPHRGAPQDQNFLQARDRRECPNVPSGVCPVGGRQNLHDQNRLTDIVLFGFIPRTRNRQLGNAKILTGANPRDNPGCRNDGAAVSGLRQVVADQTPKFELKCAMRSTCGCHRDRLAVDELPTCLPPARPRPGTRPRSSGQKALALNS
jgi:hypothetical protein